MKRILVTGGAGFLGSHLCKRLVADPNCTVTAIDNLFTGRMENIQQLMDAKNFTFIQHDVRNPIALEVDEIYHAACPASPPAYQKSPVSTLETCVLGTRNMLRLAQQCGARFLMFSTSEVYGNPLQHPQREDYWGNTNPIGIRSCYDEGKRCGETLCFDFHREFGVDTRVVRIFNTYGPNMDPEDGRVVSNFIMQALRGQPITIYGDGSQTRSFCYVDDLIEGIVRMMNCEGFLGPVNLGNPGEFTMLELAQCVLEMTQSKSELVFLPLPADDPVKRRPDISLAAEKLGGWRPTIKLEEGLARTVEYFKTLV